MIVTSAPHDTAMWTVTAGIRDCDGIKSVGGAEGAGMISKLQIQSRDSRGTYEKT